MKDEYEAAFSDLTLGENQAKPVDDSPLEDPAPKVTPEKEAAMASATSEAKAFSDAWNGEPASAQEKEDIKKVFAADAPKAAPEATPKTFGQAFKAARASGAKTFEFNGKQYNTALKADKPATKAPSAASQMPAPREDQGNERPVSKPRPSIYEAENPIRDGLKFLARGGANLTRPK